MILNSLVIGNGKVVAVGDDGIIAVSPDGGQSWSLKDSGTSENLQAVSWNGSEFVAVGTGGVFTRTPDTDLDQWEPGLITEPGHIDLRGLAYGNGGWVVVGSIRPADPSDARRYIAYRWENDEWDEYYRGDPWTWLNDVTFADTGAGSHFVAVGNDGMIMTSDDGGLTWNDDSKTASGAELHGVYWDDYWNFEFITVGSAGTVIKGNSGGWAVLDPAGSETLKGVTVKWEN